MSIKDIFIPKAPNVNRNGKWKEALLLFSVLFLPGMLTQTTSVDPGSFNKLSYHLLHFTVAFPQILLIIYLLSFQYPDSLEEFGITTFRPRYILIAVPLFLGIPVLLTIINAVLSLLPAGERDAVSGGFLWKLSNPFMIPLVLFSSILTGYREELFFRSYLLTRFRQMDIPPYSAVVTSTLLFSIGHFYQGLAGFITAAVIGAYLSVAFMRWRNVHINAIAHGLYNTFILILTLFR